MAKRKLFIIVLVLSMMISCCGYIYAMATVSVTNPFETGIVDINLTEYQKSGDQEVLWEDNPTILPGDIVSKIPRIHNDGYDCYVRAKLTFRDTDELDESNLIGIGDQWIRADDGYYYYTEILPHGADVDLFEAVSIPTDFSQEAEGEAFYIDIDVDAIQSLNFTPQFDMAQPWGDVEILACGKEGEYEITAFGPSEFRSFQIVYQGDIEKMLSSSDDFFANLPIMMPGDSYSESVTMVNDSKDSILIHFRSVALDDSELLDKIQLKITTQVNGEHAVFYEGDLKALALAEDSVLVSLAPGSSGQFHFELYVPPELNNYYSISNSAVQWIFSTQVTRSPKTGDIAVPELFLTITLISGAALLMLVVLPNLKKERRGGNVS